MDVKANKSVRFGGDTDLKFSKLSEKLGRSKQELFGQMVDYFYKSQKDPGDLNDEMLKKELGQGINRIISFIKTQEKEALTPIMADQRQLQRSLATLHEQFRGLFSFDEEDFVHGFYPDSQSERKEENEALLKKQQDLEIQYKQMSATLRDLLSETRTHQSEGKSHRETKNVLKAKFVALLDHYILHREQLNAITQGRLIRELQEHVRSQVDNL